MAVSIYSNGKWRSLEGTYAYSTNEGWKQIGAFDKLYADGNWHYVGISNDEIDVSSSEFDMSLSFQGDSAPVSGAFYYVSPNGDGDGSSWENSASFMTFINIMTNGHSGDVFCFLEGTYEIRDTITLIPGIKLYGGFSVENNSWEQRNSFEHPTVFVPTEDYDGTSPWIDVERTSSTENNIIDGFIVRNFASGVKDMDEATMKNCVFENIGGVIEGSEGLVESINIWNTKFINSNLLIYGTLHGCIIENENENKKVHISGHAVNCTFVSKGSIDVEGEISKNTEESGISQMHVKKLSADSIYDTILNEIEMVAVSNVSLRNKYYHCSINIRDSKLDTIVFGNENSSMHIINAEDDIIVGRTGDDCYRNVIRYSNGNYENHSCVTAKGNCDDSLSHAYGSFIIMDGDLYHYENGFYSLVEYDRVQIPVDKWILVTGYSKIEDSVLQLDGTNIKTDFYGYAIGDDSNLYLLDATQDGRVKIRTLLTSNFSNEWTFLTGYSEREVHYKYDNTYEKQVVSFERRHYAYGINNGYLYCLDYDVVTKMSSKEQNSNVQQNNTNNSGYNYYGYLEDEQQNNGSNNSGGQQEDETFDNTWLKISGFSSNSRTNGNESGSNANWISDDYCYGICNGKLYAINGTSAIRVGVSDNEDLITGWTEISGTSAYASNVADGIYTINKNKFAFGINNGDLYSIGISNGNEKYPIASLNSVIHGWTQIKGSTGRCYRKFTTETDHYDYDNYYYGLGMASDKIYKVNRFSVEKLTYNELLGNVQFKATFEKNIELEINEEIYKKNCFIVIPFADNETKMIEGIRAVSGNVFKNNGYSNVFEFDNSSNYIYISNVEVPEGYEAHYNHSGIRITKGNGVEIDEECIFTVTFHCFKINPEIVDVEFEKDHQLSFKRSEYKFSPDELTEDNQLDEVMQEVVHLKENYSPSISNYQSSTYIDCFSNNGFLHRNNELFSLSISNEMLNANGSSIHKGNGWTYACGQIGNDVSYVGFGIYLGNLFSIRGWEGTLSIEFIEVKGIYDLSEELSFNHRISTDLPDGRWISVSSGIKYNDKDIFNNIIYAVREETVNGKKTNKIYKMLINEKSLENSISMSNEEIANTTGSIASKIYACQATENLSILNGEWIKTEYTTISVDFFGPIPMRIYEHVVRGLEEVVDDFYEAQRGEIVTTDEQGHRTLIQRTYYLQYIRSSYAPTRLRNIITADINSGKYEYWIVTNLFLAGFLANDCPQYIIDNSLIFGVGGLLAPNPPVNVLSNKTVMVDENSYGYYASNIYSNSTPPVFVTESSFIFPLAPISTINAEVIESNGNNSQNNFLFLKGDWFRTDFGTVAYENNGNMYTMPVFKHNHNGVNYYLSLVNSSNNNGNSFWIITDYQLTNIEYNYFRNDMHSSGILMYTLTNNLQDSWYLNSSLVEFANANLPSFSTIEFGEIESSSSSEVELEDDVIADLEEISSDYIKPDSFVCKVCEMYVKERDFDSINTEGNSFINIEGDSFISFVGNDFLNLKRNVENVETFFVVNLANQIKSNGKLLVYTYTNLIAYEEEILKTYNVTAVAGILKAHDNENLNPVPMFFVSEGKLFKLTMDEGNNCYAKEIMTHGDIKYVFSDVSIENSVENFIYFTTDFRFGSLYEKSNDEIDLKRINPEEVLLPITIVNGIQPVELPNVIFRKKGFDILFVLDENKNLKFVKEIDKSDSMGFNGNDSIVFEAGSMTGNANGIEKSIRNKFIDCNGIFVINANSSLFVNCETNGYISNHSSFCTYASCKGIVREGSYNIYWNCTGTIPPENNAQSDNIEGNLITLSVFNYSENGISRFVDTGYAPSIGFIEIGECPNPVYNNNGYETWLGMFGDYHLCSDSAILNENYAVNQYFIDGDNERDIEGKSRIINPNVGAFAGYIENEIVSGE